MLKRRQMRQPAASAPREEGHPDRSLMGRSLMYLFAAGGAITVFPLAFSDPAAGIEESRLWTTFACSWGIAVVLRFGYRRLPVWCYQVFLACATLLIEWAMYASSDSTSAYAMLFFPVAIYAFYFLSLWRAVLQMLFIAFAYTAVLLFIDDVASTPVIHWAITTGTLVVSGALIGAQKSHVDRLIARLSDAARTDTLTGLLNRRGFEETFAIELERARRSGQSLTLIVGDLDSFKEINDRYGHQAGDRVIERLAQIIQTAKRRIDTAARIGGEEIAVLAPGSDVHAAYILAERLRREVRDTFANEPFDLTISLGLANFPQHGSGAEDLIRAADQALYAAKELGRDRSVVYSDEMSQRLLEISGSARREHTSTVLALAEVIDIRDAGTAAHSQTVGSYAEALARELGLNDEAVERVRFGGIVHDVGKIGIPDSILRKPGWLEPEDWEQMRRHPEIGAKILSGANLPDIGSWILAHHERPDGQGYPFGLTAEEIPLEARILAVADAYEAMTSDRVYRAALSPEQAREELRRCAGSQFDAEVVEVFLRLLEREGPSADLRAA
jgi:diguanylate cyclase (GGDEF)-like protein/putative nucleotidyltransferase with HDIG domain